MKYIFKLFKVNLAIDNNNYNKELNLLELNSNIKFLYCKFAVYSEYIVVDVTNGMGIEKLSYKSICDLWEENIPEYLEGLKMVVAPFYRNGESFIIGVIIFAPFGDQIVPNSLKSPITHTLLCDYKNAIKENKGFLYLNIFKGIILYNSNNLSNVILTIDGNISLKRIIENMQNYLPKIQIKIREKVNKNNLLTSYKLRSNSSKSIKLPTSLPATLSG